MHAFACQSDIHPLSLVDDAFWSIALPFVRLDRGILMWIQLRLRPMVLPVSFQILTSLYQWRVMMS